MKPEHIIHPEDTRLTAYGQLKDKQLARDHGLFVVEGEFLVRRLLASDITVQSVCMTDSRHENNRWDIPAHVPIYLASKELMSHIVGFPFHRGVLALGVRPSLTHLADLQTDMACIRRWILCPEINDVENLGSVMRSSAALGYRHLLLGESCCDPWARRAIRTSMGAVFQQTICRSVCVERDMDMLRNEYGFVFHAAVLDDTATPLDSICPPEKVGLLFGPEANGLASSWSARVEQLVTIPMACNVDSLNIGVAAGIFMYHYR
jgi:tRNA G18 (ribose-2'-O)-methylase SpoU